MSAGPALVPSPMAAGDTGGLVPFAESAVPAVVEAPLASAAPLPRMWMSEFRAAADGIVGEWQVSEPWGSTCRLIFEEPNLASREGRVQRRAGCFGDVLFSVDDWTMTSEHELVLLDLMGRPLARLYVITPILLRGEALVLERAALPE
jgi:hypothetical protein